MPYHSSLITLKGNKETHLSPPTGFLFYYPVEGRKGFLLNRQWLSQRVTVTSGGRVGGVAGNEKPQDVHSQFPPMAFVCNSPSQLLSFLCERCSSSLFSQLAHGFAIAYVA